MNFIGKPLTSLALPDNVLCLQSTGLVEPISECLGQYSSGRGVMTALSLMDISENLCPFFWFNTALKDGCHTPLVQLMVDNGEGLGSPLDLSGRDLITR